MLGAMDLVGRESVRDWLKVQHGVVALTGDSGIGKSAVLRSIKSAPGQAVARMRAAESSPGATQRILLDAMTQLVASEVDAAADLNAAKAALVRLGARAKEVGILEIRTIVTDLLLGVLRARFGEEAGDIAKRLIEEFNETEAKTLTERLVTARPADVVGEFADLLSAVTRTLGRHAFLTIDQAERCSIDDQSFLLDLAGRVSGDATIVVCVSTADPGGRQFASRLEARGLPFQVVSPLSVQDVARWVTAEKLSGTIASTVHKLSSGYPFFVEEAIRLVKGGGELSDLAGGASFQALLRQSWISVDQHARETAMRLAALVDRPPDDFVAIYLGISDVAWAALEQDLLHAGILIDFGGGYRWFHDRRREFIWNDRMSSATRHTVEQQLLQSIFQLLSTEAGVPRWVVSALVVLMPHNYKRIEGLDSRLELILSLNRSKLAVLYGLLELMEPASEPNQFVETALLARYAQEQLGPLEAVAEALDGLASDGLIMSSANEQMSLTTMLGLSLPGLAVFLARCVVTFGRWPIPRVASSLFYSAIARRTGPFWRASMGVGRESLANQASFQRAVERKEQVFTPHHALAVRALIDARQVSAVVIFDDVQSRDRARLRLLDAEPIVLGGAFAITALHSLPTLALPSRRAKAVRDVISRLKGSSKASQEKAAVLERADERVAALNAFLADLTTFERQVINRERSVGMLLAFGEDSKVRQEILIDTGQGRVDEVYLSDIRFGSFDPLAEVRLVDKGAMATNESFVRQNVVFHSEADATEATYAEWAVQHVDEVIEQFNRHQIPRRLNGDVGLLVRLVEEQWRRTQASLLALQNVGLITDDELEQASQRRYRLAIDLIPSQGSGLLEFQTAAWCVYKGTEMDPIVEVAPSGRSLPSIFDGAAGWGVPPSAFISAGDGVADYVLASLCGFESRDFVFEGYDLDGARSSGQATVEGSLKQRPKDA